MTYPTQIYQSEIADLLRRVYPQPTPIKTEWRAITNLQGVYCPRIDIAVGPFAEGKICVGEYNQLMHMSECFLNRLIDYHCQNVQSWGGETVRLHLEDIRSYNSNSRCLLAIEVENKVSRKHLLGGAMNASALGRLGIVVGWTEDKVKALVKLCRYWDFLRSVGKNTFKTTNLLILSPDQLRDAIEHPQNNNL